MGVRGPRPKDPKRRQRAADPKGITAIVPYQWDGPPAPRRGWLKITKQKWAILWDDPIHRAFLPTDMDALERLYDLKDERERCVRSLRKPIIDDEGRRVSPLLVRGSMKNLVLNPLLKLRADLDAEILALEDRFALNLQARLRMGVDMGRLKRSMEEQLTDAFTDDEDEDDEIGPDPRLAVVELPGRDARRKAAT